MRLPESFEFGAAVKTSSSRGKRGNIDDEAVVDAAGNDAAPSAEIRHLLRFGETLLRHERHRF
jgi:hypothetical protein